MVAVMFVAVFITLVEMVEEVAVVSFITLFFWFGALRILTGDGKIYWLLNILYAFVQTRRQGAGRKQEKPRTGVFVYDHAPYG